MQGIGALYCEAQRPHYRAPGEAMQSYEYYLLDVFTDRPFSGNPLAVFPEAEGGDTDTMQAIANELNLSETVFVGQASAPERYPIRIFTPTMELPFAGHPTVGTAHLLADMGMAKRNKPLTLDAIAGPLVVNYEKDLARFAAPAPIDIQASTLNKLTAAQLLGLDAGEVVSEPVLASCGLPCHLIEVNSLAALRHARPSPMIWSNWVSPSGYDRVYLYMADSSGESVLRTRLFTSKGGGREDPATGSAAAALAGQLAVRKGCAGAWSWRINQGVEMGRPSCIFAEADCDGRDFEIRISGQAVIVGTGKLSWSGK